jgi:hypothetical protein
VVKPDLPGIAKEAEVRRVREGEVREVGGEREGGGGWEVSEVWGERG